MYTAQTIYTSSPLRVYIEIRLENTTRTEGIYIYPFVFSIPPSFFDVEPPTRRLRRRLWLASRAWGGVRAFRGGGHLDREFFSFVLKSCLYPEWSTRGWANFKRSFSPWFQILLSFGRFFSNQKSIERALSGPKGPSGQKGHFGPGGPEKSFPQESRI